MVKQLSTIASFEAGDKTILKEVFHPKNETLNLPYSLAHASIPVGTSSLAHQLQKSDELYIVLEGEGEIFIDDQKQTLNKDTLVLVPKGATQYVKNTGEVPLVFYCIVSPPWNEKEETILNSNS